MSALIVVCFLFWSVHLFVCLVGLTHIHPTIGQDLEKPCQKRNLKNEISSLQIWKFFICWICQNMGIYGVSTQIVPDLGKNINKYNKHKLNFQLSLKARTANCQGNCNGKKESPKHELTFF